MDAKSLEPMLRNATIRALDGVARKIAKSESAAAHALGKLMAHWNDLDEADKENVASIVIATATTAVTAIVALRKKRSPISKVSRKIVKTAKKLV